MRSLCFQMRTVILILIALSSLRILYIIDKINNPALTLYATTRYIHMIYYHSILHNYLIYFNTTKNLNTKLSIYSFNQNYRTSKNQHFMRIKMNENLFASFITPTIIGLPILAYIYMTTQNDPPNTCLSRTLILQSHLISTLLCLEGMILALFIITTITSLNSHSIIIYSIPIVILVFAACEAAVRLALLVKVLNSYGTDYQAKNHIKKETELNKKTCISILVSLHILLIITFSANELIIFYILFKATLIPTLIIITRRGNQTERLNAGLYFLFYILIGSIPLLIALIHIQNLTGKLNFLLFPLILQADANTAALQAILYNHIGNIGFILVIA
ncbi:hypothetical protein A6R68_21857, partial [Neotoma lepida]